MNFENSFIITGGAGFIGSQLGNFLLNSNCLASNIKIIDDRDKYASRKSTALLRKAGVEVYSWQDFPQLLGKSKGTPKTIFHMGAISNTEERSKEKLNTQNLHYTQELWEICRVKDIPFFYASSASTYGVGALGFEDDTKTIPQLKPLNLYAQSKQEFDEWALEQVKNNTTPKRWAGFKFFNVYGAGEEHKDGQKSVLWKAKEQIEKIKTVKLFQSHHPDFEDGGQSRDFVYVEDICKILYFFSQAPRNNGIYNAGTGKARSFKDLVLATGNALGLEHNKDYKIEYVPTPESLRNQYQYFTQATLERLREAGYQEAFTELEEGVKRSIKGEIELEKS